MHSPPTQPRHNVLLRALPEEERKLIAPVLEPVPMVLRHVIQDLDHPLEYLWFPRRGVVSLVNVMEDGFAVEVATVGCEGAAGVSIVLGTERMAQRTFVQVEGEADRLSVADFRRLKGSLPCLHHMLLRYAAALITQIAQGSACNRLHPIEARCARWLLMTHDRVEGDSFELTHEFLAQMLGVTRPSVTIAAGILQKAGLIHYVRGTMNILDRPGLEAVACECYAIVAGEFARLLDPRGD